MIHSLTLRASIAALSLFGVGAAIAPLQCANTDPSLRLEDTAGDALWDLAEKFHAERNDAAARETLTYLVQKYPSSRHTVAAKDELAKLGGPVPAAAPHSEQSDAGA